MSAEDWAVLEEAAEGWPTPNRYTDAIARLRQREQELERELSAERRDRAWWAANNSRERSQREARVQELEVRLNKEHKAGMALASKHAAAQARVQELEEVLRLVGYREDEKTGAWVKVIYDAEQEPATSGFYIYVIAFDQDTFGAFASREGAEKSLHKQITEGGPAWEDCEIERWFIEGTPEEGR